jgi:hypothetical protein
MEGREHRPVSACWPEHLVQTTERIARLRWERCFLITLVLPEDDERAGIKIDVAPTKPAPPLVVRVAKNLPAAHTGIGEQRGERPIAKFLDCIYSSLVDGGVRSLVEMIEECFPIRSTPELLTIAPRTLVREFLFGSPRSRWIFSDEFLVDTPAEERRDVVPVGIGR